MDNSFEWMFLNKNPKNTTRVVLSLRAMALPKDFPCESKLSQNKSFQNLHPTDYDPLSWKNPANAKKLIFPCFVFVKMIKKCKLLNITSITLVSLIA